MTTKISNCKMYTNYHIQFKVTLFLLGGGLRRDGLLSGKGGDILRFLPICGGVRRAAVKLNLN